MRKTPTRPGPVAYVGLGLLIAAAFTPLVVRVVAYDVSLGRAVNHGLFVAACVLFSAAGGYGAFLIIRYFRVGMAKLQSRLEEVEERLWWGEPAKPSDAEDTIDLSNVRPLPRRKRPPEKRSS